MDQLVRGVRPVWFAMVMATGIVSAALRQAGLPGPAAVLLAVAAAAFVVLAAANGWRAVRLPGGVRAGLGRPDLAFTSFAFVAACGVLGNGLAGDGYRAAAAVLAAAALAGWLALACLIPARLTAWSRAGALPARVDGSWYLAAVGTQSLAIAAAFLAQRGLLPVRPTAVAALVVWAAGVGLYLVIMVLVLARLRLAGLGRTDATAPYWVAMGAASISVFAASRVLSLAGDGPATGIRPLVTAVAVVLWVLATALIPVLTVVTLARCPRPYRLRYSPLNWAVVFPLGMYAMAGLYLGSVTGLPWIHRTGAAAVWPAAAAWALTFAAMTSAPFTRPRPATPHPATPHPATPHLTTPHLTTGRAVMKRYKYQALVTSLPRHGGRTAVLAGPTCRMVVKAQHRETHATKMFNALVTSDETQVPGHPRNVTVIVLGDDAGDYLAPGEHFELWRGGDLGAGVVTRRIFV